MQLHRLYITGDITIDTPIVVLKEIADTCYLKYKDNWTLEDSLILIKKIYKRKADKISLNYENETKSLRLIAKYVNPHCQDWNKKALLKAFRFLLNFLKNSPRVEEIQMEEIEGIQDIERRTIGWQTPEFPESLNACVLYNICQKNKIKLHRDASLEEIANKVKLFLALKNPKIDNSVKLTIFNILKFQCNSADLVNFFSLSTDFVPFQYILSSCPMNLETSKETDIRKTIGLTDELYDVDVLSNLANYLLEKESNNPRNNSEAIVLAALNYKLDISQCDKPILEYNLLQNEPYFPSDKNLKERLKKSNNHPYDLINPYIHRVFNPKFPANFYTVKDLMNLCYEEGLVVQDQDYYNALHIAYLTETFIHGKQFTIGLLNAENIFLEPIEEMDYDEVVLFGIRNNEHKNLLMRAFSYGELCETFSRNKNFTIPGTTEFFNEEAINKLYHLTQKDQYATESETNYQIRTDLGEEIERIRIFFYSNNQKIEEFTHKYEKLSEETQEKVEDILTNLLHCGMYMRNWNGISDYPLISKDTTFEQVKQIEVDHRVTQSILELENKCKGLEQLGEYILNLPLMLYNKSSELFTSCSDEGEGLTIKQRLEIIKKGRDDNSCIRLSSNRIISTAYYYMVVLGFRLPFSMTDVSQIA